MKTNWYNTFNFWKDRCKPQGEDREKRKEKKNNLAKPT